MLDKRNVFRRFCPYGVQSKLYRFWFSRTPARAFDRFRKLEEGFSSTDSSQIKRLQLTKVKDAVSFAFDNNHFYRTFYGDHGFHPDEIREYEDIQKIPIVRKKDLRKGGAEWTQSGIDRMYANTGGTSGAPLSFYLPTEFVAKEKVYQQLMWRQLGWDRTSLKMIFQGSDLGAMNYRFTVKHGGFLINSYRPYENMEAELVDLCLNNRIGYLHGYPSLIYRFASVCEKNEKLAAAIRINLKGIFLCSEYPAPIYRKKIEAVFQAPTLSWYGHGEMAVLAREIDASGIYHPFHGYGMCEAVQRNNVETHLIGTSFDNPYSPFIRYDTEDCIEPVRVSEGVLCSFKVTQGRSGDFICDKSNIPISLTAFIFGRHHPVFDIAEFVQVKQVENGVAILILVLRDNVSGSSSHLLRQFNLEGINMEFRIELRDEPYRTGAGKVPLLVKENT